MGVTSGSMAGRDDGYPEMKFRHYTQIDELAKDFGKQKEEKYYELTELSHDKLNELVVESLEKQKELAKNKKKEELQKQIEKLQQELKQLS